MSSKDISLESVPRSTYRFQFHKGFNLNDFEKAELIDYLDQMGISHVYSSPLLEAREGSGHGYDVADHSRINPEIGTEEQLQNIAESLKKRGMSTLLDIVPNHVGIQTNISTWWMDVLEHGQASLYSHFFDIDWKKNKAENQVLVPFLGDYIGKVIENGELKVIYDDKKHAFKMAYYDLHLPVDPCSLDTIFRIALTTLGKDNSAVATRVADIITEIQTLPLHTETSKERRMTRHTMVQQLRSHIAELLTDKSINNAVQNALTIINGKKGDIRSFDQLDSLLQIQPYRLCYWRTSTVDINYRRFFDINQLMAIRVELDDVFNESHSLILKWLQRGYISGLRVDHPDGLYDPAQYFKKLQHAAQLASSSSSSSTSPSSSTYVLIEKILEPGEVLDESWPVHGTTGYEVMNQLNAVFVDTKHEKNFKQIYDEFCEKRNVSSEESFEDLVYRCKKFILKNYFISELNFLVNSLEKITRFSRHTRDFTTRQLKRILIEAVACFPVYRTYITKETKQMSEGDRKYVQHMVKEIEKKNSTNNRVDGNLIRFIESILTVGEGNPAMELNELWSQAEVQDERWKFIMKFQQLTGPVMAKGLEDTAFYRFFLLTSLNEVGGQPDLFGITLRDFHEKNIYRAEHWPYSMVSTTTHDAKRSEDVRCRINVLSEMPQIWNNTVLKWKQMNEKLKNSPTIPTHNEEYLLYQTLVGVWPFLNSNTEMKDNFKADEILIKRVTDYMIKGAKESKVNTNWTEPNTTYEKGLCEFIAKVMSNQEFLEKEFFPLHRIVSQLGMWNSLSQVVLKLTIPGIPDIYQGQELWDFSLVDPDNRRPVDYNIRKAHLNVLQQKLTAISSQQGQQNTYQDLIQSLKNYLHDGIIKMYTTQALLQVRKRFAEVFKKGNYEPVQVAGDKRDNVIAYTRGLPSTAPIIIATGRFFSSVTQNGTTEPTGETAWPNTTLTINMTSVIGTLKYRDIFTGAVYTIEGNKETKLSVSNLFSLLPFCVLEPLAECLTNSK